MDTKALLAQTGLSMPVPTVLSQRFWDGCRNHQLLIQRCTSCNNLFFYPSAACPKCASTSFDWTPVSGRGTIYSWIVVHKAFDAALKKLCPYVTAIVELDEQPQLLMPGLMTDVNPTEVTPEMAVEVWFQDATPDISLPRWRPVGGRAQRP